MNFEMNRDWVSSFKMSAPDYASELVKNVESAMTNHVLDAVDAHACALAAALASGNGELAFEISMDKVLFGNDIRESVAKAVIFESVNARYSAYDRAARSERILVDTHGFYTDDVATNGGTTDEQFTLFCLVVSIVNRSDATIRDNLNLLMNYGVPQGQIQSAARIASVIPAIGKCLL